MMNYIFVILIIKRYHIVIFYIKFIFLTKYLKKCNITNFKQPIQ